jgi:hypothetical protein
VVVLPGVTGGGGQCYGHGQRRREGLLRRVRSMIAVRHKNTANNLLEGEGAGSKDRTSGAGGSRRPGWEDNKMSWSAGSCT